MPVAVDTGIGSKSLFVTANKFGDNFALEVFLKIENMDMQVEAIEEKGKGLEKEQADAGSESKFKYAAVDSDMPFGFVAVAAGGGNTIGLKSNGTIVTTDPILDKSWSEIVAISAGFGHVVGLKSDGTVVATGMNKDLQCKVDGWANIVAVSAGRLHTVGLKSDGTLVATGWNEHRQCDVSAWKLFNNYDNLKTENKEATTQKWKIRGRCQHCGGELKGFFSKKCISCGKSKDY